MKPGSIRPLHLGHVVDCVIAAIASWKEFVAETMAYREQWRAADSLSGNSQFAEQADSMFLRQNTVTAVRRSA